MNKVWNDKLWNNFDKHCKCFIEVKLRRTYCCGASGVVSVAGDEHYIGPVIGLHSDTGSMRTRDMKGGGTSTTGALHTRPSQPLHTLTAVDALLQ